MRWSPLIRERSQFLYLCDTREDGEVKRKSLKSSSLYMELELVRVLILTSLHKRSPQGEPSGAPCGTATLRKSCRMRSKVVWRFCFTSSESVGQHCWRVVLRMRLINMYEIGPTVTSPRAWGDGTPGTCSSRNLRKPISLPTFTTTSSLIWTTVQLPPSHMGVPVETRGRSFVQ